MNEELQKNRHSAAHVFAAAIERLYPKVKFGVGPAIADGFYYDILLDTPLCEEDLQNVEKEMKKIIKEDLEMERMEMSLEEAMNLFEKEGQNFKVELLKDLQQRGTTKMSSEEVAEVGDDNSVVTIYKTGDFIDLCRGPHIKSTGEVGAFKLHKLAGAYWRGNEKNQQLQRVYGLVFETENQLKEHLALLEEAKKRDHRKIAKELDLYHIDGDVGLGLPLWHPNGAIIWRVIEDFWYREHLRGGYDLVRTPHIGNKKLWEQSGHWGFYSDSMYPPMDASRSLSDQQSGKEGEGGEELYLLKPMNCPFHVKIYQNRPHSYRELPMRWAECGTVYRFEKKGELSGLTRVRGFTQDDAHIICRKDQVKDELKRVIDFILFIYEAFGFDKDSVKVFLSLRDPNNKEKYAGNDEGWDFTQTVLREVAQEKALDFTEEEGEAAFYGPKLDFKVRDALGRMWQCSTLQFDFNLPERFELSYTAEDGEKETPYMLHRALFGSFERFMGLLIEHHAGAFPFWLASEQIRIVPVGDDFVDFANELKDRLRSVDIRAGVDASSEKV
ncbi:threonine--tRNA ligase, partial [Patescibacteria group bacterium]|nr:threonine--tRNA ligase [Patescibacteria group bacterium]